MITQSSIGLTNTTISYLSSGDKYKQAIVFLHGWPENSWTWELYLNELQHDYYCVAPDLPGYNFSEGLGEPRNYNMQSLIAVMREFIAAVSEKPVILVGHDWGGAIAWPLAAFSEDIVSKLIILNAAHPSTFSREMLTNPQQQAQSDYISDLIGPRGYEIVSHQDFAMLKSLYAKGFEHLTKNQQNAFITQWKDKRSMHNSFYYYQNMPNLVTLRDSKMKNNDANIPNIRVKQPTLVCWGMRDTAFVTEVLQGLNEYVDDLHLIEYESDDHWLHHRKMANVIDNIRQFLQRKTS